MKFFVYISNKEVAEISGYDFAWKIFRKTCELSDLLKEITYLVDGETGEVIEYYEPADSDNVMGFIS